MVTMKCRGAVRAKVIGVVLILVIVVGGFFLWQRADTKRREGQQREAMPPVVVTALTVHREDVPMSLDYVGQTVGFKQVEVRARVGGILAKRVYTEGQPVKTGELMFRIDPEPYKAALDRQSAELERAKARLNRAKIEHDRVLALFERQAVSQAERDDAVATYADALAAVRTASALVKSAQIDLNWTQVRAPVSGITGQETRSEGNLVTMDAAGSLLTTIVQPDPLYVEFAIPADESRRNADLLASGKMVAPKGKVDVEVLLADGTIHPFLGSIDFKDRTADPQTGAIRARAELPNPGGKLLPGQFVRVRVLGSVLKNSILVPQRAVLMTQEGSMVYVLDDKDIPMARSVDVSLSIGNFYLIESGLEDGERMVLDGVVKVNPGTAVHVLNEAKADDTASGDQSPAN